MKGRQDMATTTVDSNAKSWRNVRACATVAFAPSQLDKVRRPVAKYAETEERAVEKGWASTLAARQMQTAMKETMSVSLFTMQTVAIPSPG